MYFTDQNLEELKKWHKEAVGKCQHLIGSYQARHYKDSRAREYAVHGFSRRLKTLERCVDNVFNILPPNRADLPTMDELFDGMINIQAFVFNMFGSIDNLAWIWVREKPVRNEDGSEIRKSWVGLGKDNTFVRGSLSAEFQQYLKDLNCWFDHLEDFRHALAHRIPLFIPPFSIPKDKEAVYRQLEDRKRQAMYERRDFAEYNRLGAEQKALATFIPQMTHSIEEGAAVIEFHPQLLTDFLTVEGIAQKMFDELDP